MIITFNAYLLSSQLATNFMVEASKNSNTYLEYATYIIKLYIDFFERFFVKGTKGYDNFRKQVAYLTNSLINNIPIKQDITLVSKLRYVNKTMVKNSLIVSIKNGFTYVLLNSRTLKLARFTYTLSVYERDEHKEIAYDWYSAKYILTESLTFGCKHIIEFLSYNKGRDKKLTRKAFKGGKLNV